VVIPVRVIARSPRTRISDVRAGRVVVRVSAAPVDGAANLALVKLLAKALAVPAGTIRIAAGARTRDKSVLVAGVSPTTITGLVQALLAPPGQG
jgi:uncharacterized protein YggU (UPF0235/DUF167 family)